MHANDRQIFFLRRDPVRDIQLSQWLALAYGIERRPHIQPFEEAIGPGLHHRHVALVIGDATDRLNTSCQHPFGDFGDAHTEVLLHARTDRYFAVIFSRAGIHWYQLHIHERRLARLVKFGSGNHRIMPVENFLGTACIAGCHSVGRVGIDHIG